MWNKTARTVVKAGNLPFPITDTLMELLKIIITEEQAKFISKVFTRKPNLNMDEIKKRIDWDEKDIDQMLESLMDGGIISGTQSRSTGIWVYRLMGPFPGLFEFTLMKGETTPKEKRLVKLFDKLFDEMRDGVQNNYDFTVKQFKNFPPIDRVVPVEEKIEVGHEEVLPSEDAAELIDEYKDLAVTHCYCRHEKDLLGEPCKVTDERHNCLLLGKTAQFAIAHEFASPISGEEAKQILQDAEDYGLVHKVFHVGLNPKKDIEGICSCCKCCCGIFQLFYRGVMPFHTLTSYLAEIREEDCIGCGTCEEKCPMEAIELIDAVAVLDEDRCIGCGVCAHHCPESAIDLKRTGPRNVFLPPPKMEQS